MSYKPTNYFKDVAMIGIKNQGGVYRNGRWVLVKDLRLAKDGDTVIITAMHDCSIPLNRKVSTFDWGRWTSSNNVLRGSCNRCDEKVPDDIATLWTLFNFNEISKE